MLSTPFFFGRNTAMSFIMQLTEAGVSLSITFTYYKYWATAQDCR